MRFFTIQVKDRRQDRQAHNHDKLKQHVTACDWAMCFYDFGFCNDNMLDLFCQMCSAQLLVASALYRHTATFLEKLKMLGFKSRH